MLSTKMGQRDVTCVSLSDQMWRHLTVGHMTILTESSRELFWTTTVKLCHIRPGRLIQVWRFASSFSIAYCFVMIFTSYHRYYQEYFEFSIPVLWYLLSRNTKGLFYLRTNLKSPYGLTVQEQINNVDRVPNI